jgi:PilY1 beta-propeller domain/FG-GAP-like repeat
MTDKGLKRQGSLYVLAALVLAAAAALTVPKLWPQVVQACTEYTRAFAESFDTIDFKDAQNTSVYGWGRPGTPPQPPVGQISLPRLGSNFAVAQPGSMGARIYSCAAGDFTGDGYPDLIGLDISGQFSTLPQLSHLVLIRNQYAADPTAPFQVDATTSYEKFHTTTGPASLTVGDYNGDGLLDFFFMRNSVDEFGYTNFMATMYINVGTAFEPNFQPHDVAPSLDFTARFQAAHIYINWAADHLTSVDIDKDGDVDILAISQDRIFLIRNPGPGNFTLDQFDIGELAYDARTGFTVGRGGSCISAADFDNDGDIDIAAGTVNNIAYLAYYENDGLGHFTRKEIAIPNPSCTGSVGILGQDFTNDGWPDIFVATDAWNAGNQAHIWFLRNMGLKDTVVVTPGGEETVTDVDWLFKCLNDCQPIIPPSYDVDMSTPLDYDNDGDIDVVIADANHSGDYYLIENELAEVFELYGQAQSENIAAAYLNPRLHAVTRVRVSSIHQGVLRGLSTGLAVALYFSNNGGKNWEFYQRFDGAAIANATNLPWYDFKQFGADLRWRAVLTATEDDMAEYDGASFETPYVDDIELEFVYVDRREYSRASAAATVVTQSGLKKKLVIGSSFIFPGWEGQLRAYDVSAVSFTGGTYSALQTITSSDLDAATGRTLVTGAEVFWDAGQMLNDRNPDSRTIYTAIRANGTVTNPLTRADFTRANVGALAWFLADNNNDNAGLIDFVRGKDRYWKMGDVNHSTPVVVGPPSEDPATMGSGYAEFAEAHASRPKVLYVGANDGMLHCFDAATGEEIWGFVPYNLLRKLKNMYAIDAVNNVRFYTHDVYVDGTPAVADVQINGAWRTVLVTGQGPGSGSSLAGSLNYYWALDVTDPANPVPLWEIFHKDNQNRITMGETWSTPAIGKVNHSGTPRWVAFMGSGYDNDPAADIAGRNFYVFRLDTGELIRTVQVSQVNTAGFTGARLPYRYTNINAAIVASPTAIDTDGNGFINSVYVGDLDGRLYRMDVTGQNPSNWALTAIYTDYLNYPIITKPAVWVNPYVASPVPRVYFGTGGDDRAPSDRDYSFVGLIDEGGNAATVEWYLGVPAMLDKSASLQVGDLGVGSKVWADPVIADEVVYFSTLRGSIEAVNPCVNLGEAGRLYARYIRYTAAIPAGGTAFRSPDPTPPEYLQLISKARRAVTVGEAERVSGRVNKREIYVQEYDSTLEMLEQPIGSLLRIKSWREVYRIIW